MKLQLEWGRPIQLTDGSSENLLYTVDLEKLPRVSGIYVFGRRKRDQSIEALYVGKANTIRNRVRGQFKNLPLMMHLKKAKKGKRVILPARFRAKPGQKAIKSLPIIERALIRYFLSEGHDLVNIQGTQLRRHEILSTGTPRRFIPGAMYLERGKGE